MFADSLRKINIHFNAINHSKLGCGLKLITFHQILKMYVKKIARKKERKKKNKPLFYTISIKDHTVLKLNELKITNRM